MYKPVALSETNYILSSCKIVEGTILKNESLYFEARGLPVADFLIEAYNRWGAQYPKFYKMDQLSKLGWLAADILLKDTLNPRDYKPEDLGLVLSNANSSLDTDLKYFQTTKDFASPSLFVYTLPNIVAGEICIRHHFKGENAFFVSAEFDVDFIQQYVNNLINNNILQFCICGWVDLLGEDYKAVFFLVGKEKQPESIPFTINEINKIYQS
ncbi:MAG: hypothetical protein JST58_10195 [Bacteroidetes bacterium]|nr:hypothetical protein [Bacteroidota bacterium]